MESKNIAIAGEITPSKTIIPIVERLREYEKDSKLNFKINKIICLYHGESSKAFLEPYCDAVYSIGEGRRGKKNSKGKTDLCLLGVLKLNQKFRLTSILLFQIILFSVQ